MGASSKPQARPVPRVILITDSRRLVPGGTVRQRVDALVAQAARAFDAGVDAVQIRESDLGAGILFDLTRAIAARGPAIVTARADVAVAAGAAGVHLKSDAPDATRVRALMPPSMTLSRAVHGAAEAARHAALGGIDWFLAGTAFETAAKPGRVPLEAAGIGAIARASAVPIVAVGGITAETARAAIDAGACGVAGIGLFLGEFSPEHVDSLRVRSLE
jgi:thiamine-phosphate pyrophosphorylase